MATRSLSRTCSQLASPQTSCAARAFIQLAPRRFHHATPPPLDFLLPSLSQTPHLYPSIRAHPSRAHMQAKRAFTSSTRRQTSAIYNPQKDDDGNLMEIDITPRASNRLKQIMAKDENPDLALRFQVTSGGCHGFQYTMELTTLPSLPPNPETKSQLNEDDTVFMADDGSGAKVVMNADSLELLKGSKVDFSMELIGSQFLIADNPRATSSCGCGTSFAVAD
ncbi:hypothetical protein HYALB_00000853 [Hymenoscyphus albidus]|uniref:Core domain-containing protein n=1 Tax=Hymenoscyphus albidus TaxID=595503 RepID=A0A9N9Q0P7_9HELO|nr:hypothetical protein HYALB_00000853 [Hymenoscyphus albidus]